MSDLSIKVFEKELLQEKLLQLFGYNKFKGQQLEIIQHVLSGQDGLVIMPTGAGKSMCYQLPAVLQEGTALVISPLIALMKNQIDQLRSLNIPAYCLNSTLNRKEIKQIKEEIQSGTVKLLYVAPESLSKADNIEFFKSFKISFTAVDEAHCISEWGHDFRSEYRRIRQVLSQVGQMPIVALTATATPKVQIDIQKNLQIETQRVFKSSFDRFNLFYEVVPKESSRKQLIGFIKARKGQSGIIYCLTRKKVKEITEALQLNDISSASYHAGIDAKTRVKNQDDFLSKRIDVIVATVAFGMGIDKPDIRFVVHYDIPKSLEGYYQETGRAGRDGNPSQCLMFFSQHDINKVRKFNKDKPLSMRDSTQMLLEEVVAYAKSPTCRRSQLLLYFGERYQKDRCNQCDNCTRPTTSFNASQHLGLMLDTVRQTPHRNPISYVVDVLMGRKSDRISNSGDEKTSTFGKGKHEREELWSSLLRQAIHQGFIDRKIESHNLIESLSLSEKGESYMQAPYEIPLQYPHHYQENLSEGIEEGLHRDILSKKHTASDPALLEQLLDLRKQIAKQHQMPAYVIFQHQSIETMACRYPTTPEELLQIQGIGKGKAKKYGQPFLQLIQAHVLSHHIQPSKEITMKSSGLQCRLKINIISQVDKKIPLEDISDRLSISFDQLLEKLEDICYSGTKLNIDYHVNAMLDPDQQEEVQSHLLDNESEDLHPVYSQLSEYTEHEIRLMHIKFVSECGN